MKMLQTTQPTQGRGPIARAPAAGVRHALQAQPPADAGCPAPEDEPA